MAVIGSLSVKLGLVTVDWDKATAKAAREAKDLQKKFDELGGGLKTLQGHFKTLGGSIGVAGIGFATLMHNALSFSNEIKDVSQGFGISIAKTLQFRDALQTSGVSAEGASKMMSTLFSKIDEAKQGNEVVIGQFERMGISFKELISMKPEEAINKIFKALAGVKDQYEKIRLTKEFLGKAGIGVDTEDMAKKLGMSLTKYKEYEKSIERVAQVSDNLKTSMNNLTIAFTDLIAPFARDGLVSIEKFKYLLLTIGGIGVVKGIQSVGTALLALIPIIKQVNLTIATSSALNAALALIGGMVATSISNTESDLQKAKDMPVKKRMVWKGNELVEEKVITKEEQEQLAIKAEAEKIGRKELESLIEKTRVQKELGTLAVKEIYDKHAMQQMTEYDKTTLEIINDYEKTRLEIIKKRNAELLTNKDKSMGVKGQINELYNQELTNLENLKNARLDVAKKDEENRQSFVYGWQEAFLQFSQDATNYAKLGANSFNVLVNSMNSAIDNFVKSGKLSFKSLITSMIQDLIALQLKMGAMQIFKFMMGGIQTSLGNAFQAQTGITVDDNGVSLMVGKASGGNIQANRPVLVGENGPELVIPQRNSTVIPNNQLSSMMGGGVTNVTNNYIDAIDTKSFEDRILGSHNAVWAANQYANKSLPLSRGRA